MTPGTCHLSPGLLQELQEFEKLRESERRKGEEERRRIRRDRLLADKAIKESQGQAKGERIPRPRIRFFFLNRCLIKSSRVR